MTSSPSIPPVEQSSLSSPETEFLDAEEDQLWFPQWQDSRELLTITAVSLAGLLVIAIFAVLYFAKVVFLPITLAAILKLIFGPVVERLNRWHVPHFLGAGLIVAGICGIFVSGILFLSGPAGDWIDDAPQHFREVGYKLRALKKPMEKVNDASDQVSALTEVEGEVEPLTVQVKQSRMPAMLLNTTGGFLTGVFLTIVLLYFLLAGSDRMLEKIVSLTPEWTNKKGVVALARKIQQSVSSYLFATTCINIVLGIIIGSGMWLLGLPNPVLWGVMAACLNFVPYFGSLIGGAVVFLVGLISLDTVGQALWAPAFYYSVNALEGYFITPTILGRSISLSPVSIIIGMVLWGWLWGVGGMILAVPILAVAKIACDHIEPLRPIGALLGR